MRPSTASDKMDRRSFVGGTMAAASLVALNAQKARADEPGGTRRPNLIYVFADQLRYFSCGFAGDELACTPNLDGFAKQGINFRQAVVATPVCSAYRASLLTGKYQTSSGMVTNEVRMSPGHECFGHVLTKAGYQTAYIGKWHLWANQLGNHDDPFNAFVPPGPYRMGFDGLWAGYNFTHTNFDAPYFEDTPQRRTFKGYGPAGQLNMALKWIREAQGRKDPFALFLSWGPPHDPWSAKNTPADCMTRFQDVKFPMRPNFSETQDPYADGWGRMDKPYLDHLQEHLRGYYAQTMSLDREMDRLLKALDELKLSEDTIVVFTSDHGEMFGSHGRRAKNVFYDEAARVPFLVRWNNHIPAGAVSDACLNSVDVMPTLLSLMNLPTPKTVEGTDLSHLALGKTGAEPEAAYLQATAPTANFQDGHEWRAMRDRQYTYAIYRRDRRELLFDHQADPFQRKDLSGDAAHAAKLKHYREKLKAWMKEQNDTFENASWYRDHWTKDRNCINTAKGISQDLEQLQAIIRKHFPDRAANP